MVTDVMEYAQQSQDLDRRILAQIAAWHHGETIEEAILDQLFLDVAVYQYLYNEPYRRYVDLLKVDMSQLHGWRDIPAVPATAFKEAQLVTFSATQAELRFLTSGTTRRARGCHLLETRALYEAASLAIFSRCVLQTEPLAGRGEKALRFILCVPNPDERPDSSLGFMAAHLTAQLGDGADEWLLRGDTLDLTAFVAAVRRAHADDVALCLIGTAFAYVHVIDALADVTLALPPHSVVIETGGFKGRSRKVDRDTFYASLARCFQVEQSAILAEFGMTELTSQYYDSPLSRQANVREKAGPPWLRTRVIDGRGVPVDVGSIGALRHYDLTNRSSVMVIDTEDLAVRTEQGFMLIGRDADADPRGCSLDAESLHTLVEG